MTSISYNRPLDIRAAVESSKPPFGREGLCWRAAKIIADLAGGHSPDPADVLVLEAARSGFRYPAGEWHAPLLPIPGGAWAGDEATAAVGQLALDRVAAWEKGSGRIIHRGTQLRAPFIWLDCYGRPLEDLDAEAE